MNPADGEYNGITHMQYTQVIHQQSRLVARQMYAVHMPMTLCCQSGDSPCTEARLLRPTLNLEVLGVHPPVAA